MLRNPAPVAGSSVIGCVTEPVPKYIQQAARLLLSIRWFGGQVAGAPFFLCTTGTLPAAAESFFRNHGATIVVVERVSEKHGPSNKIRFLELPVLENWQHILLLDCDTIVVQDPSPYLNCPGLAAKIADLPTITVEDFEELFSMFRMEMPAQRLEHDMRKQACIPYLNSGVIVLNSVWRERLVTEWNNYNEAILEKWDSISMTSFYNDQASLALAIQSTGIPLTLLPSAMNLGCHLPAHGYPEHFPDIDPVIIHYHSLFDENGYVHRTPLEQTNRRINAFNARLRAGKMASDVMQHIPRPVDDRHIAAEKPKIVVGSGWWCDGQDGPWSIGTPSTKTIMFFYLWYAQVVKCLQPRRIVITDSHSPLKPDHQSFDLIQWIELDRNYGHANDIRTGKLETKYSGFTRSVINGCMYALSCDADYYVYVEQDCLITGGNFLNAAIGESSEDILIGAPTEGGRGLDGKPAASMKQQSLMIVKKTGMERFLTGLLQAEWTDGEVSPEIIMERQLQPLGTLQLPYGRSRPIDFSRSQFYAQHLSQAELDKFIEVANLWFLRDNLLSRPFYELL